MSDAFAVARPIDEVSGAGPVAAPVSLARILVCLDASDQANRALAEVVRLAASVGGVVTGIHAYAAQMHDRRFRQMEGGLPERYRQEEEMEHQREVHDDLITDGLSIISDSYHDDASARAETSGVAYRRLSPEGKNYARLVEAARSGAFDVIALGALGLGAVPGSLIGTVCERVVRRSPIDTLVVKDAGRAIGDGPIVVGLDGSGASFGGLITAFDLARRLGGDVEVHAVAAYDPYYHYVAFNRIAGVLSDEAGKVFRFKEQEQLHEELIDDGIAKIYQAHLGVAATIAGEQGTAIRTELLAGKPFQAIKSYVEKVGASLLVVGKTGVHGDVGLDIGGNTENLLRLAPCHLWIGQTEHTPPLEVIAEESVMWSDQAEAKLGRAPEFVRAMARKAVIAHAHERGHTFITSGIVDEVMEKLMPARCPMSKAGRERRKFAPLAWNAEAEVLLAAIKNDATIENVRLRAEKAARRDAAGEVRAEHVRPFIDGTTKEGKCAREPGEPLELNWSAAALARLMRVPASMREKTKHQIAARAHACNAGGVTLEIAEEGIAAAREEMAKAIAALDEE